jgi:hypothetical protein
VNTTIVATLLWASLGQSHKAPGVEQVLSPKLTLIEQQVPGMWNMEEFVFIQPRMITVDVPGKGKKLFWYMVYRIKNKGDGPRLFVPKFLLVDDKGNAFLDRVNPKVQRAIQLREDPLKPLENSVSVVGMVKPSVEEGIDESVSGVAVWENVNPKLNSFDILIEGLSNGFKELKDAQTNEPVVDPATGKPKSQRKTLVLKFARPGDEYHQNEREVRYLGHEWIYQ